MKNKSFAVGSTVAAFLASLCCLGPLVLGGAGAGAVLVSTFAPLRPYFLALSAVLLAAGFYFAYRRPAAAEPCAGEACPVKRGPRRLAKALLWVAAVAVVALALFPFYGGRLVRVHGGGAVAKTAALKTIELQVSGMTCEACAGVVRAKLLETPGVAEAEVQFATGLARVRYDATQADTGKLIAAIDATGYRATAPSPDGR